MLGNKVHVREDAVIKNLSTQIDLIGENFRLQESLIDLFNEKTKESIPLLKSLLGAVKVFLLDMPEGKVLDAINKTVTVSNESLPVIDHLIGGLGKIMDTDSEIEEVTLVFDKADIQPIDLLHIGMEMKHITNDLFIHFGIESKYNAKENSIIFSVKKTEEGK